MYLLDTGILLELRKAKSGDTDAGLIRWAAGLSRQNMYISVLTLLELETSIAAAERRDPIGSAPLRGWLEAQIPQAFEGHVLPVDTAVVKKRATLPMSESRDALMAATAAVHGLVLVTRNPAAFKSSRVKLFNPWGYAPDAVALATDDPADWREVARSGPQWFKNLFVRF